MRPFAILALAATAALFVSTGAGRAVPLDQSTCDAAATEIGGMGDVPPILERGPEWGKANLPPATLSRVARWIELQEQLSFRCGRGRVTPEALRAAAAAELIENPPPPPPAPDKPAAAKDAPAEPAKAAVKPAAKAASEPAAAGEGQTDQPAKPKPKPKVRAKPKTETGQASPATQTN